MKILLVGAGQIGSRHLQGLSTLQSPAQIYVIDPFSNSLKVAEQRFNDVAPHDTKLKTHFFQSIEEIHQESEFDLAIIATDSKIRSEVSKAIIKRFKIQNIIFEKVLFQKISEYEEINRLLEDKNIKSWVNCPMRVWPGYKLLKEKFFPENKKNNIKMSVNGGSWGIACNSIHYIDIFSFLTDSSLLKIETAKLAPQPIKSKREGYFEVQGELTAHFSNGNQLTLVSDASNTKPVMIQIEAPKERHLLFEDTKIALTQAESNNWKQEQWSFEIPYQSQLTGLLAEQIVTHGTSSLPTYKTSMHLHLHLIAALNSYFIECKALPQLEQQGEFACPIT
ncbi:MAG: Gfo/Idh/MocA family oxidoreductase [Bdellovibrio sp.]